MTRIPKPVLSAGALVVAAGLLVLTGPRAARAVAAALVQVTNTVTNPATSQDVSKQSGQLVDLLALQLPPSSSTYVPFASLSPSGFYAANYHVPANQNLVITSVDIMPVSPSTPTDCASSSYVISLSSDGVLARKQWTVSGLSTSHFTYPSGIALAAGSTPVIANFANSACPVNVDMLGYLTYQ